MIIIINKDIIQDLSDESKEYIYEEEDKLDVKVEESSSLKSEIETEKVEDDKHIDNLLEMDDYVKALIQNSDLTLFNKITSLKKEDRSSNDKKIPHKIPGARPAERKFKRVKIYKN